MFKFTSIVTCSVILGALTFQTTESREAKSLAPKFYRTKEGCICYLIYSPICGTNGRTYGNDCELKCAQRYNHFLLGVCKGECPCCKEPYHNDIFPIPFPPSGGDEGYPSTGGEGTDGWGWNSMGSSLGRWGLESMGMSFPYWNGGYTSSSSFPLSKPQGQGNYIQVVSSKTGKASGATGSVPVMSAEETVIVSAESPLQKNQATEENQVVTEELKDNKPAIPLVKEKYNELEPAKEEEDRPEAIIADEMLEATA